MGVLVGVNRVVGVGVLVGVAVGRLVGVGVRVGVGAFPTDEPQRAKCTLSPLLRITSSFVTILRE